MDEVASIQTEISSQFPDQTDEPREANRTPQLSLKKEELKERMEKPIFFRIWFGLKKKEVVKIAIGSCAAAFAGISKPVFGFFIITIGVAYYKTDPKHRVGKYSLIFSSIGFLSLFAHTLQHYLFGVVGEKAMANLRRALYSGIIFIPNSDILYLLHQHENFYSNHLHSYKPILSCSYTTK